MWHYEIRQTWISKFTEGPKAHVKKRIAKKGGHDDCTKWQSCHQLVAGYQSYKSCINEHFSRDTKATSCASTNTSPGDKEIIKRKNNKDGTHISIPCPNSIVEYNKHMGGVDHNDQIRGYYSVIMKSRKFYKYLFWAAFDVTLSNMYIISKQFPDIGHKNVKEFPMSMGTLLIVEYNSQKRRGRPSLQALTRKFCTSHFPSKAIKKGNRCHYCYNTLKKRRETVWCCEDCDTYLCHTGKADDCFRIYHTTQGPDDTDD